MDRKRKKISAEQAAFDERTKMIREHIARREQQIAAKKAAEQKA